jgi:hypothetical protein
VQQGAARYGAVLGHTPPVIARRTVRRLAALAAAVAIVAAQSVAAAYLCKPGADARPGAPSTESPCAEHLAAGGVVPDTGNANLCEVHCQDASVPTAGMTASAPPPQGGIAIAVAADAFDSVAATAPDAKGTAPPVRSRYCRLQL